MIDVQISGAGMATLCGEIEPLDFQEGFIGWSRLAEDVDCRIRILRLNDEEIEFEFVEDNGLIINNVVISVPSGNVFVHKLFHQAIHAVRQRELFRWDDDCQRENIQSSLVAIIRSTEVVTN